MNLFNQAGLKAGAERYGAVKNATHKYHCSKCDKEFWPDEAAANNTCPKCGSVLTVNNASPSARENAATCEKCGHAKENHTATGCLYDPCKCTGYVASENLTMEEYRKRKKAGTLNAGGDPPCQECEHPKSEHTVGEYHECSASGCNCDEYNAPMTDSETQYFKDKASGRDNADPSTRENAGYRKGQAPSYVPYGAETVWTCNFCDDWSPDEDQIKAHVQHEHGVENSDPSTLGYQSATSTTTARSKRKIGEKFYEVGKNSADTYTPPLRTLAQKLADGQREYGAKNAGEDRVCDKCGKGHLKEGKETDSASWFICDKCGFKMSVPKD